MPESENTSASKVKVNRRRKRQQRSAGGASRIVNESATNLRFVCLELMLALQTSGGSLSRLLPVAQTRVAASEQAQLQAWCFGFCRWSQQLAALTDQLLDKPMKAKDSDVYLLMQLGIFQLMHTPIGAHAAVDETVKVTKRLKKPWSKALVNAVLRNYLRRQEELFAALDESATYAHPQWLLERFKSDWPDEWQEICQENNQQGPMTLRVNTAKITVEAYAQRLTQRGMQFETVSAAPEALILESPIAVFALSGFAQGEVSVQDAAAQLAAHKLSAFAAKGGRLLDACSAPGGKAAHALEQRHFASVIALDKDAARMERVQETIERLGFESRIELVISDALDIDQWWDGTLFDALLLDAPCSGTGVIRRHPDIKLLRRASDIGSLVQLQAQLMDTLWRTLTPGGVMLYATCSVLKDENERQIQDFLARTADAQPIEQVTQILPGNNRMDGFFYAPLRKSLT